MPKRMSRKHPAAPTVAVAKAKTEDMSRGVVITAEFKPFQEIDVMAKVAGYVKNINVDVGSRVKEGDLLAVLEVPEMADDQARAQSVLSRSQAEVERARDELQRAQQSRSIAHLSYTRLADVAKQKAGLVAQQEIDDAQSKDLVAEAQVSAAKSSLSAAEQQVQVSMAELAKDQDAARLYPRHGAVHGSRYQALRGYRLDDSGRHVVQHAGHAAGKAVGEQPAAIGSSGPGIRRADRAHRTAGGGAGADAEPFVPRSSRPVRGQSSDGDAHHGHRSGCSESKPGSHTRNVRRGEPYSRSPQRGTDRSYSRRRCEQRR